VKGGRETLVRCSVLVKKTEAVQRDVHGLTCWVAFLSLKIMKSVTRKANTAATTNSCPSKAL